MDDARDDAGVFGGAIERLSGQNVSNETIEATNHAPPARGSQSPIVIVVYRHCTETADPSQYIKQRSNGGENLLTLLTLLTLIASSPLEISIL
jgi:hypothetical protein